MADEEQSGTHPHEEPRVRVVDRRWWARGEGSATADEPVRKPTYVEELERQVVEQAEQLQAFRADHRRSLEEFEQAKLRIRRDIAREVERGKRAILAELLDVVDNLDRAVAAAVQSGEASADLRRGVELVRDQFLAKLEGFGVARVPALGQPFDARLHEAVTTLVVADPSQHDVIVAVVREGYAIGSDLLRPAAVVVGRSGQGAP